MLLEKLEASLSVPRFSYMLQAISGSRQIKLFVLLPKIAST